MTGKNETKILQLLRNGNDADIKKHFEGAEISEEENFSSSGNSGVYIIENSERIGVQSGGCSGMSYFMEYAVEKNPLEEVVEDKGVKIFVDSKAMLYLIGTEMDYNDGEFESGFTFRNPNETGRCGCGKSFKTS